MPPMKAEPAAPPAGPQAAPQMSPADLAMGCLKAVASLRLTVALLALSVGLVFFGTLAQKTAGIWGTVDKYFWSWFVLIDGQPTLECVKIFLKDFFPRGFDIVNATAPTWLKVPFPGGKLLGGLMFLNLLAAHAVRFKLTWKRAGVIVAHAGLLLLFVGEAITRELQVEQRMTIKEGESVNFSEDSRLVELAFATPDGTGETVAVIPEKTLRRAARTKETISHPQLPVDVRVETFMTNSQLYGPRQIEMLKEQGKPVPENPATDGLGKNEVVEPKPEVTGVDAQKLDLPSAYVTLFRKGTTEKVGTYLVSLWYTFNSFDRDQQEHQWVTAGDAKFDLSLRYHRYYKPFSLYLAKFKYDRYTGTEQAKNFSSDLILMDDRGQERAVHVAMNDPLRFRGETFYQSSFDKTTEKATVLQVVRNPGWLLPYLACTLVAAGLTFHFSQNLVKYLFRQKSQAAALAGAGGPAAGAFERVLPWLVLGLAGLMVGKWAYPGGPGGAVDLAGAARIPVVDGGRVKPLDTVARVYLRKISAREQYVNATGQMRPAIEWLMECLATPDGRPGPAWKLKVVRIENDQVLSLLGLERREGYRYSLEEIAPKIDDLQAAMDKARPRDGMAKAPSNERVDKFFESGDRDVFAHQVVETADRIEQFTRLCSRVVPLMLPPANGQDWRSLGKLEQAARREAIMATLSKRGLQLQDVRGMDERQLEQLQAAADEERIQLIGQDKDALRWVDLLAAYRANDPARFAGALAEYRASYEQSVSAHDRAKVRFETYLNEFAPTYYVTYLYLMAGLLSLAGWVAAAFRATLAESLRRSAFWTLVLTFLVHGFALVARMYLTDRWLVFVTNLYSTAVFIGWAAVGLGLVVELIYPIGLGNEGAAVVGGSTAILAHNLAAGSDTLEMMQAVLDTNFWLATHVTTINLGYSATYLAGVVGVTYILLGLFTPTLRQPAGVGKSENLGRLLGQVMYGVICLATLLSFVGTVLGGIWADQSWGRFWGWDPKENGAVLIVIWNALILHARWCGLVKDRGVAVLSLVGNMITTWSYFGTNQLGVGLHAYGFSNDLVRVCLGVWFSHAALIGLGLIPTRMWASFAGVPVARPVGKKT